MLAWMKKKRGAAEAQEKKTVVSRDAAVRFLQQCERGEFEKIQRGGDCSFDVVGYGLLNWGLKFACKNGHKACVQLLLRRGARDFDGACHYAVRGGQVEIAEHFSVQSTPVALMQAAKNGHLEMFRLLVSKSDDVIDQKQAIIEAAKKGHYDLVREFLYVFDYGERKFGFAFQCNFEDIFAPVLESGFNRTIFIHGMMYTCRGGQLELLKRLVSLAKRDPDLAIWEPLDVETIAHFATQSGHMNIIEYAFSIGASIVDPPFQIACENGHVEVAKYFHKKGIRPASLKYGFDRACESGILELVELLIEDCMQEVPQGLLRASANGHCQVIRFLAKHQTEYYLQECLLQLARYSPKSLENDQDEWQQVHAEYDRMETFEWLWSQLSKQSKDDVHEECLKHVILKQDYLLLSYLDKERVIVDLKGGRWAFPPIDKLNSDCVRLLRERGVSSFFGAEFTKEPVFTSCPKSSFLYQRAVVDNQIAWLGDWKLIQNELQASVIAFVHQHSPKRLPREMLKRILQFLLNWID